MHRVCNGMQLQLEPASTLRTFPARHAVQKSTVGIEDNMLCTFEYGSTALACAAHMGMHTQRVCGGCVKPCHIHSGIATHL